jgi:hypothetical protein
LWLRRTLLLTCEDDCPSPDLFLCPRACLIRLPNPNTRCTSFPDGVAYTQSNALVTIMGSTNPEKEEKNIMIRRRSWSTNEFEYNSNFH